MKGFSSDWLMGRVLTTLVTGIIVVNCASSTEEPSPSEEPSSNVGQQTAALQYGGDGKDEATRLAAFSAYATSVIGSPAAKHYTSTDPLLVVIPGGTGNNIDMNDKSHYQRCSSGAKDGCCPGNIHIVGPVLPPVCCEDHKNCPAKTNGMDWWDGGGAGFQGGEIAVAALLKAGWTADDINSDKVRFLIWGFGSDTDDAKFYYTSSRDIGRDLFQVQSIGGSSAAKDGPKLGTAYTTDTLTGDAEGLSKDLGTHVTEFPGTHRVLLVAHSWGAAYTNYFLDGLNNRVSRAEKPYKVIGAITVASPTLVTWEPWFCPRYLDTQDKWVTCTIRDCTTMDGHGNLLPQNKFTHFSRCLLGFHTDTVDNQVVDTYSFNRFDDPVPTIWLHNLFGDSIDAFLKNYPGISGHDYVIRRNDSFTSENYKPTVIPETDGWWVVKEAGTLRFRGIFGIETTLLSCGMGGSHTNMHYPGSCDGNFDPSYDAKGGAGICFHDVYLGGAIGASAPPNFSAVDPHYPSKADYSCLSYIAPDEGGRHGVGPLADTASVDDTRSKSPFLTPVNHAPYRTAVRAVGSGLPGYCWFPCPSYAEGVCMDGRLCSGGCISNTSCTPPPGSGGRLGTLCNSDYDCSSRSCGCNGGTNHQCLPSNDYEVQCNVGTIRSGNPCTKDADCESGWCGCGGYDKMVCLQDASYSKTCTLSLGAVCKVDGDCATGWCACNGTSTLTCQKYGTAKACATPSNVPNGSACASDSQCTSNWCACNGGKVATCQPSGTSRICSDSGLVNGSACTVDGQCTSNWCACNGAATATCQPTGTSKTCTTSGFATGTACSADSQCTSNWCACNGAATATCQPTGTSKTCATSGLTNGATCVSDSQCTSNWCACQGGSSYTCQPGGTSKPCAGDNFTICHQDTDCHSGVCGCNGGLLSICLPDAVHYTKSCSPPACAPCGHVSEGACYSGHQCISSCLVYNMCNTPTVCSGGACAGAFNYASCGTIAWNNDCINQAQAWLGNGSPMDSGNSFLQALQACTCKSCYSYSDSPPSCAAYKPTKVDLGPCHTNTDCNAGSTCAYNYGLQQRCWPSGTALVSPDVVTFSCAAPNTPCTTAQGVSTCCYAGTEVSPMSCIAHPSYPGCPGIGTCSGGTCPGVPNFSSCQRFVQADGQACNTVYTTYLAALDAGSCPGNICPEATASQQCSCHNCWAYSDANPKCAAMGWH